MTVEKAELSARIEDTDHEPPKLDSHALAKEAADTEHALTLVEALRKYPKAVIWSVLISTSIIMEGYDIVLMSSFFAQPAFSKRYGDYIASTDSYQISASWQNGLVNIVNVGTILGAFLNGKFTLKYGYRKVLLVSLASMVAFVFISFFAPSLPVLLVGQFLCGIPWGVFATTAPAYASEVCPMVLRGYLTVYVNLCWALGQLVSAGVQSAFEGRDSEWSYRLPFAIQWAWPIPLFLVLWFAPESPWHYVRKGDLDSAERSVINLSGSTSKDAAKQTVAMMVLTASEGRTVAGRRSPVWLSQLSHFAAPRWVALRHTSLSKRVCQLPFLSKCRWVDLVSHPWEQ